MPVNKAYNKSDLTKEIKGMLDTIKSGGFQSFSPSNTASRTFLNSDGIYANYSGTNSDGVQVAGRVTAHSLHSWPSAGVSVCSRRISAPQAEQ